MHFQLNDYVRVKSGVLLAETNEPVPGWEGQITEIPTSPGDYTYLVELDALSLKQMPEKYLADCIEAGDSPIAYYFVEENLEHSVRRDTDEQRAAAQAHLEDQIFPPEDEFDRTRIAEWLNEFEQSPHYATLGPEAQESALSIIQSFGEYAFNYRGEQPTDWTLETVHEVCLELFPRKFTAEISFFEQIALVLSPFFGFLKEKAYLKNAGRLQQEMLRIAPRIMIVAKDPRNWGMTKSIAMEALAAGVDLSDTHAFSGFMANFTANQIHKLDFPNIRAKNPQLLRPVRDDPFKNTSRNQVVKVQYTDGSSREGKFKRLEEDLKAGKCTLL